MNLKTYNTYFTTLTDFEQFLNKNNIKDSKKLLVQIFTAYNDEKNIKTLLSEIDSILPNAFIIGASTDGEICNGVVSTGKTVISLSVFEKTKLNTAIIENCADSKDVGKELALKLIDEDTKLIITFTDGLHCNGDDYLKGISSVNNDVIIAGGLAGDNGLFTQGYVFTHNKIISNGAVGVSLSNPELQIYTDYNFDWLNIGKDMVVTKAEKNRVYTIDNIASYDIYKKYLGVEIAQELPFIGVEFPLIIKKDNHNIARAVVSRHKDGSLTFAGNIDVGDIVTFGYGDAETILKNSIRSHDSLKDKAIESIFIYSCTARRRFMPTLIQQEIESLNTITNCSGFFTYGEFFSTQTKNELLNQTMTILTISESKEIKPKKASHEGREIKLDAYQKSIQALSHMLKVSIDELHYENDKLEKFSKEILAKEESLNLAQEIGHFGSWEIDFATKESTWSKETYNIYKVDSHTSRQDLSTFLERVIDEDKQKALKTVEEFQDGTIKSVELRAKRDDGVVIHILVNGKMIFDETGAPLKIVGTTLDITEIVNTKQKLVEQTKALNFQTYHDHLTKLPNRTQFLNRLKESITNANKMNQIFAVLFIDLDNFKEINDTLGHNIGDKVLQLVSKRISTCIRNEDSLSRLGGDEFTVLLYDLKTPESAADVAQKILDIIKSKITIEKNEFYLSASIGISIYPKDSLNGNDLLKFADSAMYKAKNKDKNNYQFYSSDMTEIAFEKVLIQTSLHIAINKKEFIVYYQPQVDAKNNIIIGLEALVRWNHPTMGMIPPIKFIPIAEENGFIITLDNYVMKQAMIDFVDLYKNGFNPGILSLNLSIKQLGNDSFISYLKKTIEETGFDLQWLEFEITETQMMQDPLSSIEKLNTLSDMGIKIAIDDFGTGYSSLTYLKRLPVDKLKIDKSFIDDIPSDEEDCAISKAIIALAKSLNLKTIAEGVENKEQKEFLLENGCNLIQGYFYSRPLPKEEITVFLKKQLH